jgi:hypothetical protein
MVLRTLAAVAAATLLLAGCADDGETSDGEGTGGTEVEEVGELTAEDVAAGYDRDGWDPEAEATGREVAARLVGVPNGCPPGSIDAHPWDRYRDSYRAVDLPMPAASVGCFTAEEDDLHVEVFASAEARDAFIEAKADLICERGYAVGEGTDDPFPGLPYIDGGDDLWIIETDTIPITEQLAPVAGGTVANMCPQAG